MDFDFFFFFVVTVTGSYDNQCYKVRKDKGTEEGLLPFVTVKDSKLPPHELL